MKGIFNPFLLLLVGDLPPRNCATTGNCEGGAKRIKAVDVDLVSFTYTGTNRSAAITAATFDPSAVVAEINLEKETKQLTQTGTTNGCSRVYEQSFTGQYKCPHNQDFIDFVEQIEDSSCCGLVFFIDYQGGDTVVIGDVPDYYAEVDTIATDTGTTLDDTQLGTITLKCRTNKMAVIFQPGYDALP